MLSDYLDLFRSPVNDPSWVDLFGIIISFTAILVAVLSVYVAFVFTRTYLSHVNEIVELRREASAANSLSTQAMEDSKETGDELKIAIMLLYYVVSDISIRADCQNRIARIDDPHDVSFSKLSAEEKHAVRASAMDEVRELDRSIQARMREIAWLSRRGDVDSHGLIAIASRQGDQRTIELLNEVKDFKKFSAVRDHIVETVSRIELRLHRG